MEKKSIYSVFDTDSLKDYIVSNLEFFGLETDADGIEIPEEIRDMTMAEVIANSTDGRLKQMISAAFNDFYGRQVMDTVYEQIDAFVYDEVNTLLKKHLGRRRVKVTATATYQVWDYRDYAINVDELSFDCSPALDRIETKYLPTVERIDNGRDDGYGDLIFAEAVKLGLVKPWDGPFCCVIDDAEEYELYLVLRETDEND